MFYFFFKNPNCLFILNNKCSITGLWRLERFYGNKKVKLFHKFPLQWNHHCGQNSAVRLVQTALILVGRGGYCKPERGSRWLSDMGDDEHTPHPTPPHPWTKNWASVKTKRSEVPLGCWNGPGGGVRIHNTDLSSEVLEHFFGPCHLVLIVPAQVTSFHRRRWQAAVITSGPAVIRGYDPRDLAIVVAPRAVVSQDKLLWGKLYFLFTHSLTSLTTLRRLNSRKCHCGQISAFIACEVPKKRTQSPHCARPGAAQLLCQW